jgi:hypothetical protein
MDELGECIDTLQYWERRTVALLGGVISPAKSTVDP